MANQITHIVLAERISDKLFKKFDQSTFLVGTVFPDIRYLKVIDRDKTHFHNLILADILDEKDSFVAGIKYHSLVDEVRRTYIFERGIYNYIPSSKYITQSLTMYEDELFYSKMTNWSRAGDFLNQVLDEEIKLVIDTVQIKKWHFLIQDYLKKQPTDISRKNFIMGVGSSEKAAVEMNELIKQMRRNLKVQEIFFEMYKNWNSLVLPKK